MITQRSAPGPVTVAHPDVMRAVVEAAVMAPSSHNTQPWRFRLSGTTLELFADRSRHLRLIDAERRQQIMSCGCALFNARLALRTLGFVDEVTTVLARDDDSDLVATVRPGAPHIATEYELSLHGAIARRHTNRHAFLERPVSAEMADALIAAARVEGVEALRLEPVAKQAIAQLIEQADQLQYSDPAFRAELERWLTPRGSKRTDGVPFLEKEFGTWLPFALSRKLHSPGLGTELGRLERELVEGSPLVLVMGTTSDDPAAWVRCGQAVQAVLLLATTFGLAASFLNQIVELPAWRERVLDLAPGVGMPQMVLRLGVPSEPVHHPAPRRPIADVLEIV